MYKSVTKAILAKQVSDKTGISNILCEEIISDIFLEIQQALIAKKNVRITNFGNFEINYKNARPGRNPLTKQEYTIPARYNVSFKTSKNFKKELII